MTFAPDFETFVDRYNAGKSQLASTRIVSDLETPVSCFLKLAGSDANAFLLESVEGGEQLGRYSIIGQSPDIIWRCRRGRSEINRNALDDRDAFAIEDGAPLDNLKRLFRESEIDVIDDGLPPMAAGVFGYLGYDMVRQMETLGSRPPGGLDTPDSIFIRPTILAVFDNVGQEILMITPVRHTVNEPAEAAWRNATDRLDAAVQRLNAVLGEPLKNPTVGDRPETPSANTETDAFKSSVAQAKEYIAEGDIFQVVLSLRYEADFNAPPFELYRALRRTNPSPFMFYLNFDEFSLVGSSPEILVRVRDGDVTIRPIAGTRWRGKTPDEDVALGEELLADEKERAEHLMLLDLGRNDVGRSSKIGSVTVTEQFAIERYSHVMHIVSNVVGRLREDVHPVDAVSAGFPAGTVTGAPKIRAMEIIDELETEARGVYGGAIGYFSADGNVDTCIALRTAVVKQGKIYVQAGAGVVADSNPESELTECRNKAKALFAAADAVFSRSN